MGLCSTNTNNLQMEQASEDCVLFWIEKDKKCSDCLLFRIRSLDLESTYYKITCDKEKCKLKLGRDLDSLIRRVGVAE